MTRLFLFGTLRHKPLLDLVLGAVVDPARLRDAALPDYRVAGVAEGPFPLLVAQSGATAAGLVLEDVTDAELARIDFYEACFAYRLTPVALSDGTEAQVYVSPEGDWTPAQDWSLPDWEAAHAQMTLFAAEEVMSYRDQKSPEWVGRMFFRIRARAAAKVRGGQSLHGTHTKTGQIETVSRDRAYAGFFAYDTLLMRHETFSGGWSETVAREVFVGTDASIVLPYDPVLDRVLLVEQIRWGPWARGDKSPWLLEPVAGLVDAGETPEDCAYREAKEEAGLALTALLPVAEAYASPGSVSDFFYIYVGLCSLADHVPGVGGLEEEGEDIRSHVLSFEGLMDLSETRQLANAPLAVAIYWLAHHRGRLRAGG